MTNSFTIHHTADPRADTSLPDSHQDTFSKTILGFWLYLLSDCLLFATLFVTYAVLRTSTFGGPTSHEIFDLTIAFAETMLLLLSSVTCGFVMLAAVQGKKDQLMAWLGVTFVLGASYIALEITEFSHLVAEGHSWRVSAFLSSFFTLVGAHGLHVAAGLLWIGVLMVQLYWQGINIDTFRRLAVFSLYWHFLDLIWIFIFTFVYLMGVV